MFSSREGSLHPFHLVAEHILRLSLGDDLSLLKAYDFSPQEENFVHIVRDRNDGKFLSPSPLLNARQQRIAVSTIDARERLIKKEQATVRHRQRPRKTYPLPFSAGQFQGKPLPKVSKSQQLKYLFDERSVLGLAGTHSRAKADVLFHRQVRKQASALRSVAKVSFGCGDPDAFILKHEVLSSGRDALNINLQAL